MLAPCASGRDRVVPGASAPETSVSGPGSKGQPPLLDVGTLGPVQYAVELGVNRENATSSSGQVSMHAIGPPSVSFSQTGFPRHPEAAAGTVHPPKRHPWAELRKRVFEVDALCCPRCGERMRILAAITDADVARRILACLSLPTRAPPTARARGSPGSMSEAYLDEFESPPGYLDLDQSLPEAWDTGA